MTFKNISVVFYLLIFMMVSAQANNNQIIPLVVAINQETYQNNKLENTADICKQLPNIKEMKKDRPLVELSIICLAFKQQGFTLKIKLLPTMSYTRSLWLVKRGIVDVFAQSVWEVDIESNYMHASIDVIRKGEFTKGVYTIDNHPMQSLARKNINLANYVGIIPSTWHQDLAVMKLLTNNILNNNYYPAIFKLLAINRADFTLMEFSSNDDLSIYFNGYRLKPINGIKITIPLVRKFVVSKNTTNNQFIFNTLNKGLTAMRKSGEIQNIYLNSGFINNKTQSWQVINGQP